MLIGRTEGGGWQYSPSRGDRRRPDRHQLNRAAPGPWADGRGERHGARSRNIFPKVCCRGLAESLPTVFMAHRAALGGAEFPRRAAGGPAGAEFVKENAPELEGMERALLARLDAVVVSGSKARIHAPFPSALRGVADRPSRPGYPPRAA
jgi:hypothetical protein